ncbi:SAM-dependent methyltransferase [Dactylosporangium sp. CA-233914]|uniref:SAM-dependent methyltransferase n=1 Tax=Dactylosporangium sp. CA-233914 TaxID=3239934 RepID=UPI003D89FC42
MLPINRARPVRETKWAADVAERPRRERSPWPFHQAPHPGAPDDLGNRAHTRGSGVNMIHTVPTFDHWASPSDRRRASHHPPQSRTWVREDGTAPPTTAGIANRIYGGFYNRTVDRKLGADIEAAWPPMRDHLLAGRAVQGRIVRHLLGAGVRQFLDIGAGIAQHGATHEVIAAIMSPDREMDLPHRERAVRVVYVDIDPITTFVNAALLDAFPWAAAVCADLQHPATFLNNDIVNDLLDFAQPVGVLLLGVLHHLPHRPGAGPALRRLAEALSYGSYLSISHLTTDLKPAGAAAQRRAVGLLAATPTPLYLRHPAYVAALLHDRHLPALDLLEPGFVPADQWRPDPGDQPPFVAPHLLTAVAKLTPPASIRSVVATRPAANVEENI